MLAHALLPHLVFELGFIQTRSGVFEFFRFCFMSKYFLMLLNFTRYIFSVNTMFFIDEKHTQWMFRSNHQRCSVRKCVLGNFTTFTGKHLCQGLFFNKVAGLRPATLFKKRPWQRFFPVNVAKFIRTPFFAEYLRYLLLSDRKSYIWLQFRGFKGGTNVPTSKKLLLS